MSLPQSESPISRLPLELLDEVFSILEESDYDHANPLSDCRRCALVCRMWARLCRKYMFKTLRISNQRHALAFHAIVQTRASIKSDVERLWYSLHFDSGRGRAHSDAAVGARDDTGDAEFLQLHSILDLLSNQKVKSLKLRFFDTSFHGTQNQVSWSRVPDEVKKSLVVFIRSNKIMELELHKVAGLPAAYLSAKGWLHPTLASVYLEWVSVSERVTEEMDRALLEEGNEVQPGDDGMSNRVDSTMPANDVDQEASVPKLEYFGAYDCDFSGLVASMRPYVAQGKIERHPLLLCFADLKKLLVSQTPLAFAVANEPSTVMEFLQYALRSTQCLEYLSLEGDGTPFDYVGLLSDNLSFSSLQTLSRIELLHLIRDFLDRADDPYFHFTEELSRLKNRCLVAPRTSHIDTASGPFGLGLKMLNIELMDDTDELPYAELAPWSRLDEVLAGSAESERVFCKLEYVRVHVEVGFMTEPEPRDFRRHLRRIEQEAFPRLRANARINFVFPVPKEILVEESDEEGSEGESGEEEEWDSDEHQLD